MSRLMTCAALILILIPAPGSQAREGPAPAERAARVPPTAWRSPCAANGALKADGLFGVRGDFGDDNDRGLRSVGEETLWIFDADFEDLSGDNAGWTSLDMSGTLGHTNYWHKDTIRINGFEWLGDSTWWCGTYSNCWAQPRGYGNNWTCILSRECPEVAVLSTEGDSLVLSFDQRFAMENNYDYGYVELLADGDPGWTTVWVVNNVGFAGHPGNGYDWDDDNGPGSQRGHVVLDISGFAGRDTELRFRFESDPAYSSQDQHDNPPHHSVLDGAWQIDNIRIDAWRPDSILVFLDDCESPGDNGWVHENLPASGQTGVAFERVFEPDILRPGFYCWWRPEGWWMAALDAETGKMVDGQNSWLLSPPIDISGANGLVAKWDAWIDCSRESNDRFRLWLAVDESAECLYEDPFFTTATPERYGGPYVYRETEDWDLWAPGDWLCFNWRLWNDEPPDSGAVHMTGFMLDRQRVGVPVGGPPTEWNYSIWDRFHDTFDINEALSDEVLIGISDSDGIVSAFVVASSDAGQTWEAIPLTDVGPGNDDWLVAPLVGHIAPSAEIWYYFEATDGTGNVRTHPRNAPDAYYEFSILPILGSVSEPAILLVDKHGRVIRNEDGEFRQMSENYFREALDILGFEYDVYDVEVPSGSTDQSNGPDSAGCKYYDTQIWFMSDFNAYTVKRFDQVNLISWLSQSQEGKERNLLLTGNDIGSELMEYSQSETLDFYTTWLASEYVMNDVAELTDTLLMLRDAAGGFDFMTHGDNQCVLRLLEWDYG